MQKNIIIKNISMSFLANILVLFSSILINLLLPNKFNVQSFGYWQLYIMYNSYTTLLHLGWTDGIYLRYGGIKYEDLDKGLLKNQFVMLLLFELLVVSIIYIYFSFTVTSLEKIFIIKSVLISGFIVVLRSLFLFTLLASNEIKKYSIAIMIDKAFLLFSVVLILLNEGYDFRYLISLDILGKMLSFCYAVFICRDIVLDKSTFFFDYEEAKKNITTGLNISIAFLASTLVIGSVRFGIEKSWGIIVFSKISLMLSLSNLFLTFINSLGLVFFPVLRNISNKNIREHFKRINFFLTFLFIGLFVFYTPLRWVIQNYMHKYTDGLLYLPILFPIILYEGKMALLYNTLYKVIRAEKVLMKVNLISLFISVFFTYLFAILIKNLLLTIFLILFVIILRYILSFFYLNKRFRVDGRFLLLELGMTAVFIFDTFLLKNNSMSFFILSYFVILFFNKDELKRVIDYYI